MHKDMDALACMEAMHVRVGRLETMWDARYVEKDGGGTRTIRDTVMVLHNQFISVDKQSMSKEQMSLELVSIFEHSEKVMAQTWMTTSLHGLIHSVRLRRVLYNKRENMGVYCPTTVCEAEVQIEDIRSRKTTKFFTIKFRKATGEQEALLQPGKTLAEIELDNILRYKEVLGPEVWDLFPAFIMAIRLHNRRTDSVWEGIGMQTLGHIPVEQKSTSKFYKAAFICLEKLHRAGASHGNPTLDSFMVKQSAEGTAQLCLTNFCTFRPFPLQNWSVGRCYNASMNDLRSEHSELFITKVMVLMDHLKLFWLNNPRIPLYAEMGEQAFNERYLHIFRRNNAGEEHMLLFAPWTPTRILCLELDWDFSRIMQEVGGYWQYTQFLDDISLQDITTHFKICANTENIETVYRTFNT